MSKRKHKIRSDPWLIAIADGEAGDSCQMRILAEERREAETKIAAAAEEVRRLIERRAGSV